METRGRIYLKSIYSGVILSIASIANMSVDNRVAGAFLFSIGLTSVFVIGAYLYTGAVGNTVAMHERGWLMFLLIVLAGNLTGTLLCGSILRAMESAAPVVTAAADSWETKCAQSTLSAFVSSCFCGFLMYTAWNANTKLQERPIISTVVIVLCVMVFVLARFDHSIANAFLLSASTSYSAQSMGQLFVMVLGNSVGAVLPAMVFRS